ncbi:hypothetical protein CKO11_05465 [Rhodobacter sp. TJ_12]|uniref:hypothetical protein n=1 Tax=Rhodobacter sp. TJ_12 TaxID=2029399 RepID=UPI001CC097BD|nr:hypothetical protein [Rhodobacter sp. TJ_12]MBZ4021907.1 hypothetical protein [Rhodobacter sp. TJ_12]
MQTSIAKVLTALGIFALSGCVAAVDMAPRSAPRAPLQDQADPPGSVEPPGTSPASAIPAESVAAEYAYVAQHFPGWQVQTQGMIMAPGGRPIDVLTLEKAGVNRDLYFDISSFFVTGL